MIYFYDFEQFELGCLFSTEICRGDIENIKNERVNERRVWGLATKSSLYSEQLYLELVKTIVNHGKAENLDFYVNHDMFMIETIFGRYF